MLHGLRVLGARDVVWCCWCIVNAHSLAGLDDDDVAGYSTAAFWLFISTFNSRLDVERRRMKIIEVRNGWHYRDEGTRREAGDD